MKRLFATALCVSIVLFISASTMASYANISPFASNSKAAEAEFTGFGETGVISYEQMCLYLSSVGFTEDELIRLGSDASILFATVYESSLSQADIDILKSGYLNSPSIDPKAIWESLELFPVVNGVAYTHDTEVSVPNNYYIYTDSSYSSNLIREQPDQLRNPSNGGPQIATFTEENKQLYKVTSTITLPSVSISSYPFNPNASHYGRPYMMYGVHGNGVDIDIGIVYFVESGWVVFGNGPAGWADNKAVYGAFSTSTTGTETYTMTMELSGGYLVLTVKNSSGNIVGGVMSYYASGYHTNTPVGVYIARDTALAQSVRNTSNYNYLSGAKWQNVMYYKWVLSGGVWKDEAHDGSTAANYKTTISSANWVPYGSTLTSYPRYLYGDHSSEWARVYSVVVTTGYKTDKFSIQLD